MKNKNMQHLIRMKIVQNKVTQVRFSNVAQEL